VVSGNLHAAGHGNQENYQNKSLKGDHLAYVPEQGTYPLVNIQKAIENGHL
jgi:hypothetical protein